MKKYFAKRKKYIVIAAICLFSFIGAASDAYAFLSRTFWTELISGWAISDLKELRPLSNEFYKTKDLAEKERIANEINTVLKKVDSLVTYMNGFLEEPLSSEEEKYIKEKVEHIEIFLFAYLAVFVSDITSKHERVSKAEFSDNYKVSAGDVIFKPDGHIISSSGLVAPPTDLQVGSGPIPEPQVGSGPIPAEMSKDTYEELKKIDQNLPGLGSRLLSLLRLENELKEKTELIEEARKSEKQELVKQLEQDTNSLSIRLMMERAEWQNLILVRPSDVAVTGGGSVKDIIQQLAVLIDKGTIPLVLQERYPKAVPSESRIDVSIEEMRLDARERTSETMREQRDLIRETFEERELEKRYPPATPVDDRFPGAEPDI